MSKKIYDSKFSDKKVTAAQYIAQLMCERKSKKDGVKLTGAFWNDKEWKKFFLYQVSLANNLLKIYPEGAIIQVLARPDLSWAWSLNTKQVLKAFEKIARTQEKVDKKEEVVEVKTTQRIEKKEKTLFDLI